MGFRGRPPKPGSKAWALRTGVALPISDKPKFGRGRPPKPGTAAWVSRYGDSIVTPDENVSTGVLGIHAALMKHKDLTSYKIPFSNGESNAISPELREKALAFISSQMGPGKNIDNIQNILKDMGSSFDNFLKYLN